MQVDETTPGSHIAGFLLAVILGVAGALALIHWGTCSQEVAMCAALVTPTRLGWWRRLRMTLRALQLRWLIRAAEDDLQVLQATLGGLPRQIAYTRQHVTGLRLALARVETDAEGLS